MIRYKNTDNGMIVEAPDYMAAKYDFSVNMERIKPEPAPREKPKKKAKKKAAKK